MNSIRSLLGLAVCLAMTLISDPGFAQTQWDRQARFLTAIPVESAPGRYRLRAVCRVAVESSPTVLNLDTTVEFRLNGTQMGPTVLKDVTILPQGGFCIDGPPCGGGCGSAILDGGDASLLCQKDGCISGDCFCSCGAWLVADGPFVPLEPGDEITVILRPASGALPEGDTTNDMITRTHSGGIMYYDRAIDAISVDSHGTLSDVRVDGHVKFDGLQPSLLTLDMEARLYVNGVQRGSQMLTKEARHTSSGTCYTLGCGYSCGQVDGIELSCDDVLFNGCVCGGLWFVSFYGVPGVAPGDEITVILYPAPGALPEVQPLDDELVYGVPSDAGDAAAFTGDALRISPNPMASGVDQARILYALSTPGPLAMTVFDASGRSVKTLFASDAKQSSGVVEWDGRDGSHHPVPAGTYFVRMNSEDGVRTEKLLVVH